MYPLVLFVLALHSVQPLSLPPTKNLTAYRFLNRPTCLKYECAYNWALSSPTKALAISDLDAQNCTQHWAYFDQQYFSHYTEGDVGWDYLLSYLRYMRMKYCYFNCGLTGYLYYVWVHAEFSNNIYLARINGALCLETKVHECRWDAYQKVFSMYFAYGAVPFTLVANWVNVATLRQTLTGPRCNAALYLHLLEVATDCFVNLITIAFACTNVFDVFIFWQQSCQSGRLFNWYNSATALQYFTSFLNQGFLTALAADRFQAINRPIHYSKLNQKHRATFLSVGILLGSLAFCFPLAVKEVTSPIHSYWWGGNTFYDERVIPGIVLFYALASIVPVLIQAVLGLLIQKRYSAFISSNVGFLPDLQAKKKEEKKKKQLLMGTIVLNICTQSIKGFVHLANDSTNLLELKTYRVLFISVSRCLDLVFTAANGSGAVLIHVLCSKHYREAFLRTKMGKLISRENKEDADIYNSRPLPMLAQPRGRERVESM